MQTATFTRADEAFAAAMSAQLIGIRIKLGRHDGIWTVTALDEDTTKSFRAQLTQYLRDVRYSPCVELLREDTASALGMIHSARFNGLIDGEAHANLYALLRNAKQHAYDDLASKAIAPGK